MARHFLKLKSFFEKMTKRFCNIVNDILPRNAFFAQPEIFLIATLVDDKENVRKSKWKQILMFFLLLLAKKWILIAPKQVFYFQMCYEMIDWWCTASSEAGALQYILNAATDIRIESKMSSQKCLPCFLATHKLRKRLVTKASPCTAHCWKRDRNIIAMLQSRKRYTIGIQ